MIRHRSATLVGSLALLVASSVLCVAPAFAQDAAPSPEYGQGAGVTRARTLPRTGDGSYADSQSPEPAADSSLLLLLGGAAALMVGVSGGTVVARQGREAY